jgi:hypothetical protein
MAGGGGVGENAAPLSNGGGGNLLASGFASTALRPQASFDGVAPAFQGQRTGGPGIGPPRDMVRPQQPVPQQMMRPMPSQMAGLQALLMQMQGRFNQPMMRGPMPQYGRQPTGNPLTYRPNMQAVQQNLSRVRPSVYKSDLDAAKARIAELERAQQSQPITGGFDVGYGSGGG